MSQFLTIFLHLSKLKTNFLVIYCCVTNYSNCWRKSTAVLLGWKIPCDRNANDLPMLYSVWVLIVKGWKLADKRVLMGWVTAWAQAGMATWVPTWVCVLPSLSTQFLVLQQVFQEIQAESAGDYHFLLESTASLEHTSWVISKFL